MIKRNIVETIYEYDKDGKLTRKSVTETHETDDENEISSYQFYAHNFIQQLHHNDFV